MSSSIIDLIKFQSKITEGDSVTNTINRLWLDQVSDTIPIVIYIYDVIAESNIYINKAITNILGYLPENFKQIDLINLVHNEDISLFKEQRKKWLNLDNEEILKLNYRAKDIQGNWHWLKSQDLVLSRTNQGKVQQIVSTISDITEQKKLEIKLQKQIECERLITDISKQIHQSFDLSEILETTVTEVRNFLQIDRVIIYQLKSDWSGIVVVESVDSAWKSLKGMTLVDETFANNYIPLYKQGRIQATTDIYQDDLSECHIHWLAQLQVRANLVIPIVDSDDLWGLLVAQNCNCPRKWNEDEIDFLQRLAIQVGIAIEQAELYQELKIANQQWQLLASTDGLTNIANRRFFDQYLSKEWKRSTREQVPLSLILCDVDYFKKYNDIYGHQGGDYCLQKVARELEGVIKRPADLVARYGGEEFVILLPNTNSMGAVQKAGEIRSRFRVLKLAHQGSDVADYVTMSFGVATMIPSQKTSPQILIEKADQALYDAKKKGRDRIVLAGE